MKLSKYFTLLMVLLAGMIAINSCELKELDKTGLEWSAEEAKVYLTTTDNRSMLYVIDGDDGYFYVDTINYELSIAAYALENFVPASVEVYMFIDEKIDDENFTSLGDDIGKKLLDITEFVDNKAQFTLTLEQINELYGADLQSSELGPDDLVKLKYVVTDANGATYDTRTDCYGAHCQEIVQIEKGFACTNRMDGVYSYEIIEKGGPYATGTIGATGTITIDRATPFGVYEVSDVYFGQNWMGAVPGEMHETNCEGIISFPNANYELGWEFRNFDGASVDIIISEYWWADYIPYGWGYMYFVVRITRESGEPIPEVTSEYERVLGLP